MIEKETRIFKRQAQIGRPDSVKTAPMPRRLQWLVSVRSRHEAILAAKFSIDVLDFKEPRLGPLAPVPAELWHEIVSDDWDSAPATGRHSIKLSAALGDADQARECATMLPAAFDFAKAGPGGCAGLADLDRLWHQVRDDLPPATELVAVAYADHSAAGCPSPEQILARAAEHGFGKLLLDTFDKRGGSAIEQLGFSRLSCFAASARRLGLWWAFAGSVRLEDLDRLRTGLGFAANFPDCIAVRGAICEGGRAGRLCPQKLERWQAKLDT